MMIAQTFGIVVNDKGPHGQYSKAEVREAVEFLQRLGYGVLSCAR